MPEEDGDDENGLLKPAGVSQFEHAQCVSSNLIQLWYAVRRVRGGLQFAVWIKHKDGGLRHFWGRKIPGKVTGRLKGCYDFGWEAAQWN